MEEHHTKQLTRTLQNEMSMSWKTEKKKKEKKKEKPEELVLNKEKKDITTKYEIRS